MKKEKVLAVVKTYPNISKSYRETVCTAGITESGEWIRMYPIPFRLLTDDTKFKKYQWVEVDLKKNDSDQRPESYKVNASTIRPLHTIEARNGWEDRKDILFKAPVHKDMTSLIEAAHNHTCSLALFKATKILKCLIIPNRETEWNKEEKRFYELATKSLFDDTNVPPMPKIPFDFKLQFSDINGKISTMQILDWEISQLYLNMKKTKGVSGALTEVKKKIEWFQHERDLYLILGTTRLFNSWASNPYTIIGFFYPPKTTGYTANLFDA